MKELRPPRLDEEMRVVQWAMWGAHRRAPDAVWLYVAHADRPGYAAALVKQLRDDGIHALPRSSHMLRIHRAASVARFLQMYVGARGTGREVRLAAARYGRAWARRAPRVTPAPDVVAECTRAAEALMEVIPCPTAG